MPFIEKKVLFVEGCLISKKKNQLPCPHIRKFDMCDAVYIILSIFFKGVDHNAKIQNFPTKTQIAPAKNVSLQWLICDFPSSFYLTELPFKSLWLLLFRANPIDPILAMIK